MLGLALPVLPYASIEVGKSCKLGATWSCSTSTSSSVQAWVQDMKTEIKHLIGLLPDYVLVGMISFGMHVTVHELGFHTLPKGYLLHGERDVSGTDVSILDF